MKEFIKQLLSEDNVISSIRYCLVSITTVFELISIAFAIACITEGKFELLKDFCIYFGLPAITIYTGGKYLQKKEENKEQK